MIKHVIFDFDGVILESNDVKIDGFFQLFKEFGEEKAREEAAYFQTNAGLSRYDVIRHFFKKEFDEDISEEKVLVFAKRYSLIVKDEVLRCSYVNGFENFLNKNSAFEIYIVSSSAEDDLKYICKKLNIDKYFKEVLGSPIKKAVNIKNIMTKYNLNIDETIYIGDSINDYHATMKNALKFIGRNSGVYDFDILEDILVVEDLVELEKKIKDIKC